MQFSISGFISFVFMFKKMRKISALYFIEETAQADSVLYIFGH